MFVFFLQQFKVVLANINFVAAYFEVIISINYSMKLFYHIKLLICMSHKFANALIGYTQNSRCRYLSKWAI